MGCIGGSTVHMWDIETRNVCFALQTVQQLVNTDGIIRRLARVYVSRQRCSAVPPLALARANYPPLDTVLKEQGRRHGQRRTIHRIF